jgi:nucleoside 2-deoxyribosyltransferase
MPSRKEKGEQTTTERNSMKKIYLAGPDVFDPDPITTGKQLKALCAKYGLKGLFPLDNVIKEHDHPHKTAQAIREANIDLIKQADFVMANLNPFRGFEPDSGTVYEVGFAEALGKPVFAYAQDRRQIIERLREHQHLDQDALHCVDGKSIETFALSHNLMFAHTLVADTPEACIVHIKHSLDESVL